MSATPPTAPRPLSGAPRRWLVPLAALALAATGCGLPGSGPDADEAARALATALSKGSVASVPFTGDAAASRREYAAVTDGLARLGRPRVTAGGTSTDGDTGRSTLRWRWTVGEEDWSYQTRVRLAAHRDLRRRRLVAPVDPEPGRALAARRGVPDDHGHRCRARGRARCRRHSRW